MAKSRTKDRGYLRNRAQAFAQSDVCWICGQWIDMSLKFPDPMSASGDHVIPISRGGDNRTGRIAPAHLQCNMRRGWKPPPRHPSTRWVARR
jgi:hypothetical protein